MATYDITSTTPERLKSGDILTCDYTGSVKTIELPEGSYKLEVWGAQGGNWSSNPGGYGGYSVGTLTLTDDTTLYLYAGGIGGSNTGASSNTGGFNGGGGSSYASWNSTTWTSAGGGGSDIRIGQDSLYARVIVAGGGGGATSRSSTEGGSSYGWGGGTTGGNSWSSSSTTGASQTAGGTGWVAGSFGTASTQTSYVGNNYRTGGGGGGWYGGGIQTADSSGYYYWGVGGGGSGYVYTSSTASNYPSGCLLNSSYYLTDAQTIGGNQSFSSPSGGTETGHQNNGYVKITVLSCPTKDIYVKPGNEWKRAIKTLIKINDTTWLGVDL